MLRPSKFSHPDRTIVNVATLLLATLKTERLCALDDLLGQIKRKVLSGELLFLPALNFLFLLGLIDYRAQTDSIEYTGPHNETL